MKETTGKKVGPVRVSDRVLRELKIEAHRRWEATESEPTFGTLLEEAWDSYRSDGTKGTSDSNRTKDFNNSLAGGDVSSITMDAIRETLEKLLENTSQNTEILHKISEGFSMALAEKKPMTEGRTSAQKQSRSRADHEIPAAKFHKRLKDAGKDASNANVRTRKPADESKPA